MTRNLDVFISKCICLACGYGPAKRFEQFYKVDISKFSVLGVACLGILVENDDIDELSAPFVISRQLK